VTLGGSAWATVDIIETFRANRGVVPGELQSANFLLLTTTSVKSGAKRTTPLVYHRLGERLLTIASTGGGPTNPGWFDNLAKNPSVRVELGAETWEGRAIVLSGAERDALFAAVVKRRRRSGGIKKARSARSRWSSYYLQSSERAIGHRPTSRCVAAVLRLQRGCGVRGWGRDGLSYHVDCYQRPTDERKGR
jgi:deazaflavin-dependent oxidoreductase (nitroreductase family)